MALAAHAAFISYSSEDQAFAKRVHRTLERYRVPKSLGSFRLTDHPDAENRLLPCFLDRDELPSGELTEKIQEALRGSSALVVICSTHSAGSDWVDSEVRYFKSLGRADRIFAIITPDTKADEDARKLFCPALQPESGTQVLAGDARKGADGFRNAFLKVVAGILGITLGRLILRERARQIALRWRIGIVAAVVLLAIGGVTIAWLDQRTLATSQSIAASLRDIRQLFEREEMTLATTQLAHLWPRLSPVDQARYQSVLSEWWTGLPDPVGAIAAAADETTLGVSNAILIKSPLGLERLPFSPATPVIRDPRTGRRFALDPSGNLWRQPTPRAAWSMIRPAEPSDQNNWSGGHVLANGLLLFSAEGTGSADDRSGGGLLFVEPASESSVHVALLLEESPAFTVFGRCEAIGVESASAGHYNNYEKINTVVDLRTGAARRWDASQPIADRHDLSNYYERALIEEIVRLCGGTQIADTRDEPGHWTALPDQDPRARYDDPAVRQYITLGNEVARLRFDTPGQTANADALKRAIAQRFELAAYSEEPLFLRTTSADVWIATGYYDDSEELFVFCTMTERAKCTQQVLPEHVSLRALGPFVYAPKGSSFQLLDTRDLAWRTFPADEGSAPPNFGASSMAALSPSGKKLASMAGTTIQIVAIPEGEPITLLDSVDLLELRSQEAGELTFMGEDQVVIARRDGIVVLVDLPTRKVLWTYRLPQTTGIALAALPTGNRVAVRGANYAAVLDGRTGLPVRHLLRFASLDSNLRPFESDGRGVLNALLRAEALLSADARLPSDCAANSSATSLDPRAVCERALEIAHAANAARDGRSALRVTADDRFEVDTGGVYPQEAAVYRSEPSAAAVSLTSEQLRSIRCRTGWSLEDGEFRSYAALHLLAHASFTSFESLRKSCAEP